MQIKWLADWNTLLPGERFREGRIDDLLIKVRSIFGGDSRYRPIIEITSATHFRKPGPRGGMSLPTRNVASHIGKPESAHRHAITQGLAWLTTWYESYSVRNAPDNVSTAPGKQKS